MVPEIKWAASQPILHRPRLSSLIEDGLKYPLLVMLAAPGYGKTQAMMDYISTCGTEILWLHLNALDNLPERFWARLTRMLEGRYPQISEQLKELNFPDNIQSFSNFMQIAEDYICTGERVIWVFDDYGVIENQQIREFIHLLVDSGLVNFHLVLLSNALNSMETIAFMTTRRALLLADDMRFNKSEIRELYRLHGIRLKDKELDAIERYTEGWPMPLCLLAAQNEQLSAFTRGDEGLTPRVISYLFEERFFSTYLLTQQKLLLKLSMMDSFTIPFVVTLYEGQAAELELLRNHAFLINEPTTERFYLHHLYRAFLREKSFLLKPEEEKDFWQKAAEYYINSGDILEAIPCYYKAKDCGNMLEAIRKAVVSRNFVTDKTGEYYLKYLDLLTVEETKQNPVADCIRAMIYTYTYRMDKAEILVVALEDRLSSIGTAESIALLGEIYIMHGLIRMMDAKDDFGQYYRKAAECLPNGSTYHDHGGMKVYDHYSFFMPDNSPGSKERIDRAMQEGLPWVIRVMGGSMSGMQHIFTSEVAYLSYELEEAKQHAYHVIYEAEANAQYDLVCNAYRMLARIGFMQGNYQEMTSNIQNIVDYSKKHDITAINEIRDTSLAWYYSKLFDVARIPKSALSLDGMDRVTISSARRNITYAIYLIGMGEYAKLVGFLEHLKQIVLYQYITQESIALYIILALGHHHLGNTDSAMEALWTAYDMCYNNELITLFIEADKYMLDLIAAARQQNKYHFAPDWLDMIERETAAYIKRAEVVRAEYRKRNPAQEVKDNPLSNREISVLQAVARGLTREEIALEQYISINTVKSTITSVFNKLGANNKADAVSIAMSKGYIEGHTPEYETWRVGQ